MEWCVENDVDEEEDVNYVDHSFNEERDSILYFNNNEICCEDVLGVDLYHSTDEVQHALDSLDDLFNANLLTESQVSDLKTKCRNVCEAFIFQKRLKKKRLDQAKRYTEIIERQNQQLENFENSTSSDGVRRVESKEKSEVSRLRERLLRRSNDLMISCNLQDDMEITLKILEEEKNELKGRATKLQTANNLDAKMKNHLQTLEKLDRDVATKNIEVKTLKENLNDCRNNNSQKAREIAVAKDAISSLQHKFESLRPERDALMKCLDENQSSINCETERLNKLKNEIESNQQKILEGNTELTRLQNEKFILLTKKREGEIESYKEMTLLRSLKMDYECSKNREKDLLLERTQLDIKLNAASETKKQCYDGCTRSSRELNSDLRVLKRKTLTLDSVKSSYQQTARDHQRILEMRRSISTSAQKNDRKFSDDLLKEIERKKDDLKMKRDSEADEGEKMKQLIADQEELLVKSEDVKKDIQKINKVVSFKMEEKDSRAKDLLTIEQQLRDAQVDLKKKRLESDNHELQLKKINSKFQQISSLYNALRSERSKISQLFLTGGQTVLELKEKLKLLMDESLVLQHDSIFKENLLQKQHSAHLASSVVAERLRSEVSSIQLRCIALDNAQDEVAGNFDNVDKCMRKCFLEVSEMRSARKCGEERRERCQARLVERKKELEGEAERHRILENIINKANVSLSFRDEEIKMLKMQKRRVQEMNSLLKEKLKNKTFVENKLTNRQIQLCRCQERLEELESKFNDSSDDARIRFLDGKNLSDTELCSKLDELVFRISQKTKEAKEKDVIYERISSCTKHAWEEIKTGECESLSLTRQECYLRSKVARTTLRVMALIAEMSMRKTEMLSMEQLLAEKKSEFLSLQRNYENDFPSPRSINKWDK